MFTTMCKRGKRWKLLLYHVKYSWRGELHEGRDWDEPLPPLTVAYEEQDPRLGAGGVPVCCFSWSASARGGSVSLGLAKSSDSIREARLGGLHSAHQARTVGELPEVVARLCLYEKWRRFMLPRGKEWGFGVGEKDI